MCNGHQILSPVDKATVLPIIGNSVGVVGFVLYCVYVQQAAALCCGNCLVFPNPGKELLVSPSISKLRGEIFQIEGSLRVSFEDVLLWAGQQCQSGQ